MKASFLSVIVLFSSFALANAQEILKGVVLELDGNAPIQEVNIKNLETGLETKTAEDGSFAIGVKKNERLQFEQVGFRTDTLLVTEYEYKRVYLTNENVGAIELSEVQVRSMTDNQLQREIREAEKQGKVTGTVYGGGIAISPSRWFGGRGKEARRKYRMLKKEEENRKIDARFTKDLVAGLVPLKGDDLIEFMINYRPKIDFIERADDEQLKLYVVDSYADFKKKREK